MSDIFLSYKSEDKAKAQIIAGGLERNGYSVWWDRVIPPGRRFREVIQEELDSAKCVVVLWSIKSVKSTFVEEEASDGHDRGILIPVLIEEVKPPLGFRGMQAAKLIDWDGKSDNHEFDLLIRSVERIIGRSPAAEIIIRKPDEEKSVKTEEPKIKELKKLKTREDEIKIEKKKEEKNESSSSDKDRFVNSIGMKFAFVPAGEFMMGSEEYDSERPVQKVTISEPFYLGVYPVTQQEWTAVMKNDPSRFKGENLPVEKVSWNDVQEFVKKLNEKEGSKKYRLPSEAEWEYAARAGTTTRYSFGEDESKLGDYAWYDANSGSTTHEVGQKKPNPWGLYDMHGNVWEWVQDNWHNDYNGAPTDGSSWESGDGSYRVLRGGSWGNDAGSCRSAFAAATIPASAATFSAFAL